MFIFVPSIRAGVISLFKTNPATRLRNVARDRKIESKEREPKEPEVVRFSGVFFA